MSDIAPHTIAWQATYNGTLDDDFGVADLFDLSMADLKSITHWQFDVVDGTAIDLVIVGVEYARKVIEPDLTPVEGENVSGEAEEDFSAEVTVVQQIKLLSSHYKYSMMVVHKFEWMTPDLGTTLDEDVLDPLLIMKGAEDMAKISWIMAEIMAEGAEIKEEDLDPGARRHLLASGCPAYWPRGGLKPRCKVKQWLEETAEKIVEVVEEVVETGEKIVEEVVETVEEIVQETKEVVEETVEEIVQETKEVFKETAEEVAQKSKEVFKKAEEKIVLGVTKAIDATTKFVNKVKDGLSAAVNWYGRRAARLKWR